MPSLLDLCCGAGGAAMGYSRAGFTDIVGVDNQPQKNYPFEFVQADMFEYLVEHGHEFDAIHVSPPCQGYSIMRNLPWFEGKEYPTLILPIRQLLEKMSILWVIENVLGARKGSKGLIKYGLEEHGMDADYLCGTMFGLPFYRHRLFETNWKWAQPEHAKHQTVIGSQEVNRPRRNETFIFGQSEDARGLESWPGRREEPAGLATVNNPVNSGRRKYHDGVGSLARWQGNGAQKKGVGVGHAAGWRIAAEAMDIDWMKRGELTQAIPPAYTEYIGAALLQHINQSKEIAQMKEVTIIFRNGSRVGLGVLEQVGRKFYHLRFVDDAFQGGTEPSKDVIEVPIEDVELIEGFDYEVLIGFQDRTRDLLMWRGRRQSVENEARTSAMQGVEAKVARDTKAWEKTNPKPVLAPVSTDNTSATAPELPVEHTEPSAYSTDAGPEDLTEPDDEQLAEAEAAAEVEVAIVTCTSLYNGVECDHADSEHKETHEYTIDGNTTSWSDEEQDKPEQEPVENFRKPVEAPVDGAVPF